MHCIQVHCSYVSGSSCFGVYSCSWTTFIFYVSFNSDIWFWLNFWSFLTTVMVVSLLGLWLLLGCDNDGLKNYHYYSSFEVNCYMGLDWVSVWQLTEVLFHFFISHWHVIYNLSSLLANVMKRRVKKTLQKIAFILPY